MFDLCFRNQHRVARLLISRMAETKDKEPLALAVTSSFAKFHLIALYFSFLKEYDVVFGRKYITYANIFEKNC